MADYINWEYVRELSEQYGTNAIFRRYASFEGMDPTHSALLDDEVDVQPPWKYPHRNDKITSNAEQFTEAKTMASLLGREVMTAREYREYLGLPQVK